MTDVEIFTPSVVEYTEKVAELSAKGYKLVSDGTVKNSPKRVGNAYTCWMAPPATDYKDGLEGDEYAPNRPVEKSLDGIEELIRKATQKPFRERKKWLYTNAYNMYGVTLNRKNKFENMVDELRDNLTE